MCYFQVFSSNTDFPCRVYDIFREFKSVKIYRKTFVTIFSGWEKMQFLYIDKNMKL